MFYAKCGAPEVKTFKPTSEDLRDLSNYLSNVTNEAGSKTGIVKLILPQEVKNTLITDHWEKIKEMEVPRLNHQHFEKVGRYKSAFKCQTTFGDPILVKDALSKMANDVDLSITPPGKTLEDYEQLLWHEELPKLSKNATEKIYLAGIQNTLFTPNTEIMNFNNLPSILKKDNPMHGIQTPYLYVGLQNTCFAWHTEDYYLLSLNILHCGNPKVWYCIPPKELEKFESMLKKLYSTDYLACRDSASHKYMLTSPEVLIRHKIPFVCVIQNPNEIMVTYPGAYHQGFNTGPNIAEAINFGNNQWLKSTVDFLAKTRCTCSEASTRVSIDVASYIEPFLQGKEHASTNMEQQARPAHEDQPDQQDDTERQIEPTPETTQVKKKKSRRGKQSRENALRKKKDKKKAKRQRTNL